MPRILKHPDARREELLAIAAALFAADGYERTSIDDIIGRAGLSKGAFYYHYPSKEALLEALAGQAAAQALAYAQGVLSLPAMSGVDRLAAFFRGGSNKDGAAAIATFGSIFRPENLHLYHRIHRALSAVLVEPLSRIIAQGVTEGSFAVEDARSAAEIVLLLGAITHDLVADCLTAAPGADRDRALAAFERRLIQQGIAIDRILGLPDHTIRLVEPGQAGRMLGWPAP